MQKSSQCLGVLFREITTMMALAIMLAKVKSMVREALNDEEELPVSDIGKHDDALTFTLPLPKGRKLTDDQLAAIDARVRKALTPANDGRVELFTRGWTCRVHLATTAGEDRLIVSTEIE